MVLFFFFGEKKKREEERKGRGVCRKNGPDQLLSCFGRQYSEGIAVLVVWPRPRKTRRLYGEEFRSRHFD